MVDLAIITPKCGMGWNFLVAIFEILMNLVHDKLGQFSRQKVNDSEVIRVTKVTILTVFKLHMKRLVESGLLASVAV